MRKVRASLPPECERLPINANEDALRHQRKAEEAATEIGSRPFPAIQPQRGVKKRLARVEVFDANSQALAGYRKLPAIIDFHWHERRNMKFLANESRALLGACLDILAAKDVAVPLSPGSVVDLSHDCLQLLAVIAEAKIERHRIHHEAEVARLRQQ